MANTYSSKLRLIIQTAGDNSTTWGTYANTNFGTLLEEAICGMATVAMADANTTMSTANGSTDEARQMIIKATGANTASRNLVCPAVSKLYCVHNATTGGYSIVFKTSGGSGITVPNGAKMMLFCDGTDVVAANTYISGLVIGTDVQAYDADLAAAAALSTTGLIARTGSGTMSTRTLTAPAAGVSVSNGDGVSGNPTLALANDLSALEGLASTGIAVRSASDTWVQRTVTAGSNIQVTNGDGVSGNPTIAVTGALLTANNLSEVTAATARTNLGLGTIATQASNNVSITGGTISVSTVTATSDERLKDNIHPLHGALDMVRGLNGKRFTWNKDSILDGKSSLGLIAQQVEWVLPELVHTDSEGIKSIEYGPLCAVLIEAIKTLECKMEMLERRA